MTPEQREQGCEPHGHINCTACADAAVVAGLRQALTERDAEVARLEARLSQWQGHTIDARGRVQQLEAALSEALPTLADARWRIRSGVVGARIRAAYQVAKTALTPPPTQEETR